MRSAKRRLKIENNKKNSRRFGLIVKLFFLIVPIVAVFLFLKLTTSEWDGKNKIAFVYPKTSGETVVIVLDPTLNEETALIIPGDTEVNVARNYGTLKMKNVWQLGINEKLGGKLVAETVTNNFLFPTTLWVSGSIQNPWSLLFTPGQTNIPFGDRLHISLFMLKVKGIDSSEIDLGKSQFLKKQILTDGTPGFVLSGPISGRLTIYFSDNTLSNKNIRFGIVDFSGSPMLPNRVGAVLEILGGKVVMVDRKEKDDDLDCQILGKNLDAVKKISKLFSCQKISGDSSFDLELRIGAKFAKRF